MATIVNSSKGTGAPPPPPNNIYKCTVVADDSSGSLQFTLDGADAYTKAHMNGSTLRFDAGLPWYSVEYTLDDSNSSVPLKFNQAEAACMKVGKACPPKGSGNNSENQISVTAKSDKKLTLENKNQQHQSYSYTLFFTDTNNPPNEMGFLDPIYDNGGGGHN